MSADDYRELPDDLAEIGERLRAERLAPSAIELDQIKRVAMARASRSTASRSAGGRHSWRRLTGVLVAGSLVIGGTGGVLAATGVSGGDNGSAAKAQYCPPGSPPSCGEVAGEEGGGQGDAGAAASAGAQAAAGAGDAGLPFTGMAVGGLLLVSALALGVGLLVRRAANRAT